MLRGGAFLLQKDYLIHKYFIALVVDNSCYQKFFDISTNRYLDDDYYRDIELLIKSTEEAYHKNISFVNGIKTTVNITDTLSSKILLGVYGCVPAYDRYFKAGLKFHGINSEFNKESLEELRLFYNDHFVEFDECYQLFKNDNVLYTPMKLVDMYFWQVGYLMSNNLLDENLKEFADIVKESKINTEMPNNKYKESNSMNQRNPGLTEQIRKHVIMKLNNAKESGEKHLDVRAGDIEKEMKITGRIPAVVNAMRTLNGFNYDVVSETHSGYSTSVVYRYKL